MFKNKYINVNKRLIMGIKHLNKFLQNTCKDSIKKIHLHQLSNKKIVIDTSIYMYRYLSDNTLLENIYLMINIFRKYNIMPLFVFDGKPPKEKNELLKERKLHKKVAEEKYNTLQDELFDATDEEKNKIQEEMRLLKKEFVRLHHSDIENVKILIQSLGVSYIEAPGEADKLCAKMVNKNMAYACLSEDMDMFVYGCKRVLRYLSLLNNSVILYDLKLILTEIDMTFTEFKHVCIISGTDYNIENNNNLMITLKWFRKYKKSNESDFITWIKNNTNYINDDEFTVVENMFDINDVPELKSYLKTRIINSEINISNLKNIMKKENFIFVNK